MSHMQLQELSGTSKRLKGLHNIGRAHGHYSHPTLESFVTKLLETTGGVAQNLVSFTNSLQTNERSFLKSIGFEELDKGSGVHVHVISKTKLEEFFNSETVATLKAEAEERVRVRKEAQAAAWAKVGREPGDFLPGDVVSLGGTVYTLIDIINGLQSDESIKWCAVHAGSGYAPQYKNKEFGHYKGYDHMSTNSHRSYAATYHPSKFELAVKGIDY